MKQVTIVVPVYNEADNIADFVKETQGVCEQLPVFAFSYLFVNDGSTDETMQLLRKMNQENAKMQYLSFSRNFGKEAGILAGLSHAQGEYVILMDGDLQHPPALIAQMLHAVAEEGYEAAGAKRKAGTASRAFTNLNNRLSDVKIQKGATDYMCMSRKFVNAVLSLSESQRFSKGLFAWVGFSIKWFSYEQKPRQKGKSKWSFSKLFSYAADGLTSFSTVPLKIVTLCGVLICFVAFVYILATLIKTFIYGIDVPGYVTTLCAVLFLGGIILLAVGILGAYIGRIYLESKDRPLYILQESKLEEEKHDE